MHIKVFIFIFIKIKILVFFVTTKIKDIKCKIMKIYYFSIIERIKLMIFILVVTKNSKKYIYILIIFNKLMW